MVRTLFVMGKHTACLRFVAMMVMAAAGFTLLGQSSQCKASGQSAYGTPTFAPERRGLSVGISLAKHTFRAGEPISLHLWVYNSSDRTGHAWTCGDASGLRFPREQSGVGLRDFMWKGFDLYDASGRRLLNRSQQELVGDGSNLQDLCTTDKGRLQASGVLLTCLSNVPFPVAAHGCLTGRDSWYAFDLRSRYKLPAGRYTIRFRDPKGPDPDDLCRTITGTAPIGAENPDLTFLVTQP